jgi:ribosomal protein S18 acetylase RimI-like enzyme
VVSLSVRSESASPTDGLRPVNLRTDLAPLADLIELAFNDTMDSGGRAAVREMRTLSRMGAGLNLLSSVNDITQGVSLGYVWQVGERIVGNVSIYPANWPRDLGSTWIIANVATHPEYRGRGIAQHLITASMHMIAERGGKHAVLQVDAENGVAQRLYERAGFVAERAWTTWRRSSTGRIPDTAPLGSAYITRRRRADWRAEYALAQRVRPAEKGGLGWLRPLHRSLFQKSLIGQITDWVSLRSLERLAVYNADRDALAGVLWIENAFAASSVQLTLMVEPDYAGWYDEALLTLAVRRYGFRQPVTIEHPADELITNSVLQQANFRPQRTLVHMRWDAP